MPGCIVPQINILDRSPKGMEQAPAKRHPKGGGGGGFGNIRLWSAVSMVFYKMENMNMK